MSTETITPDDASVVLRLTSPGAWRIQICFVVFFIGKSVKTQVWNLTGMDVNQAGRVLPYQLT